MADRISVWMGSPEYRQLWRVVDGAVATALHHHPEFKASTARARTVRNSIVKRVVGSVMGYAAERARSAADTRSGSSPARDKDPGPI